MKTIWPQTLSLSTLLTACAWGCGGGAAMDSGAVTDASSVLPDGGTMTDSSTPLVDSGSPSNDSAVSRCPPGVTEYSVTAGAFMATDVTVPLENCGIGLTAAEISPEWVISRQADSLSIATAEGGLTLGEGALVCNSGTLVEGGEVRSAECIYTRSRSTTVMVTANDRLAVVLTETRTGARSVAGQTCRQPPSCMIRLSLTLSR